MFLLCPNCRTTNQINSSMRVLLCGACGAPLDINEKAEKKASGAHTHSLAGHSHPLMSHTHTWTDEIWMDGEPFHKAFKTFGQSVEELSQAMTSFAEALGERAVG